jgi:hypothetical protein
MRQALHIFRKDVRYLRYELSLVVLFTLAFAAMHYRAAHNGLFGDAWIPEVFLFIGLATLIGRLVSAEAIPGDRQFWITRPYQWKSLLGAKVLFILTFANLPIFLAQLAILMMDGFPLVSNLPGLLWSQVLLLVFSLPFVAFATLSSIKPFQLILLAFAAGLWALMTGVNGGPLAGVAWVPASLALVVLFATAVATLLIQYKSRRTIFSRWLAGAGLLISGYLFVAMPWPVSYAVQSRFSKQPALGSSIQMTLGQTPAQGFWLTTVRPKFELHVPISVEHIPGGTEIRANAFRISFHSPDGRGTELDGLECRDFKRTTLAANSVTISLVCYADAEYFDRERNQPLAIDASLYFTLFGNARSQTIPLSNQPVNALDGLQCYTDNVRAQWDVYCRSAFRWPARLVYAKLGQTDANSFTESVSYSPFPADLDIEPVQTRWASTYASGPTPIVEDVTIVTEEPLAHLRRDFKMRDVQLVQSAPGPVLVIPVPPQKPAIQ